MTQLGNKFKGTEDKNHLETYPHTAIFLFACACAVPVRMGECPTEFQILEYHPVFKKVLFLFPSGVYFQGTTIGMAPIMSMCTAEQSGGIVMVSHGLQGADRRGQGPFPLMSSQEILAFIKLCEIRSFSLMLFRLNSTLFLALFMILLIPQYFGDSL